MQTPKPVTERRMGKSTPGGGNSRAGTTSPERAGEDTEARQGGPGGRSEVRVGGAMIREAQVRTPDFFLERLASPSGPSSLASSACASPASPTEPGSRPT